VFSESRKCGKAIGNGRKIATLTFPPDRFDWFWTPVYGFDLFPLLNNGFSTVSNAMITAFSER